MLEAETIHTVITNLQDSGLKLTLVATFFTMTIFKNVIGCADCLTTCTQQTSGYAEVQKFLFCSLIFVGETSLNTTRHTSWVSLNIWFALCRVNWFCIICNTVFKINGDTVQCKSLSKYVTTTANYWRPYQASWRSAIEICIWMMIWGCLCFCFFQADPPHDKRKAVGIKI